MKRSIGMLAICGQLFGITMGFAQQNDTLLMQSDLQEVVVSGSKFNENSSKLAVSIRLIKEAEFKRLNVANMGNLLEATGNVFVQRSQQGGGSPVIRGFEASRVLLMVDGVRMNNAIYRAGHLQNIITIDPNSLQRLEVLYGPSSTLYGSDALGGVVNMFTYKPQLASTIQPLYKVNTAIRYASATKEKTGHASLNIGGKKWASFSSLTFSDFGDVSTGKHRSSKYGTLGLNTVYPARINGRDTALISLHPHVQQNTGYHQYDVVQKIMYAPNATTTHLINLQISQSSNISRFDRLSEIAGNLPRFSEWYYGPQKRNLASYTFEKKNVQAFMQEVRLVASYQYIEESRYDRRYKNAVLNQRIERVNVGGFTLDARKRMNNHEVVIGADAQLNYVKSIASGINVNTGTLSTITTRYPDGKNRMHYAAIYAQHLYKITEHLTLNDGLRISYVTLDSRFKDTSLLHLPYTRAGQDNVALTGNAGLAYAPGRTFKTALVFSTGFRAPNIDDLTKVFDTRAGTVVVPNPGLKPEYTYNLELNTVKYFELRNDPYAAQLGGSVFYTWFTNAIVTDRFTLNGKDSIIYMGVMSGVFASQNKARAYLWGYNLYGRLRIIPVLEINGTATYTYGRFTNNSIEVPLDHVPPVYGRAGLKYEKKQWYAEAYTIYNGWKRIKDYNPSGEDNQQYATTAGMPSWFTINTRLNYSFSNNISLQLAVENIADKHYRTFASGISSPGINLLVGAKYNL